MKRDDIKKSSVKRLRRAEDIPAVLYGGGRKSESIYVKASDFYTIIRKIKPGRLSTTIFELLYGNEVLKALVRDIHYHTTNYLILHIDFGVIEQDKPIHVNVPIVLTGEADCVGVKLGGLLRQLIRALRVSCLPKHIPSEFVIDVQPMNLEDYKRLSDIELPKEVRPLAKMNEIAVTVAKQVA